jgi:hypothetical protein
LSPQHVILISGYGNRRDDGTNGEHDHELNETKTPIEKQRHDVGSHGVNYGNSLRQATLGRTDCLKKH